MTSYDHFLRLLVMVGLILGGLVATALVSFLLMLIGGMSLAELMEMGQTGAMDFSPGLTRGLLMAQHIFTFILPSVAFGLLFYRSKFSSGMDLSKSPGWMLSILGIFFLLAAYPLVNLSFLVNEAIPLPAWATQFENQAEDTLKSIMDMKTPLLLLVNLLIIAVLPGIGEELVFRGILQKQVGYIFKNQIAAIWIAGFIFSAIHLQFEGFLPRMVLGVVLGYLYYWTQNLWVPIIAHAFNNGIQVIIIYVTGTDVTSLDQDSSEQLQWWMLPLSVVVMFFIYTSITKSRKDIEQA